MLLMLAAFPSNVNEIIYRFRFSLLSFIADEATLGKVENNVNFVRVPYDQELFILIFRNLLGEFRAKSCLNSTLDVI